METAGDIPRALPEASPASSPIYVLPVKYGYIFIIVFWGMLWGSTNYSSSLGYVLTFMLGSMAFVSILHTHRNLKGIQVLSVAAGPVFAGEEAEFELLVRVNRTARYSVRFKFEGGTAVEADLEPDTENRIQVRLPALGRGILAPGALTIWTRYPFGLFRAWTRTDIRAEALVYPHPSDEAVAPGHGWTGENDGGEPGPGVEDFKGIRAYQPGDPMQRIAWKASTRSRELMTKEFQGLMGGALRLDWREVKAVNVEERLSRLCRMVLEADRTGRDYGLFLPGVEVSPDKGEAHKRRCLEKLALFGFTPSHGRVHLYVPPDAD